MIKECKVILNNGVNMVVVFDDRKIQMPSVNTKASTLFIKQEKGRYSVVDEDEYKKSLNATVKKVATKAKKEVIESEDEE